MTISSLNKTTIESNRINYKTLEKNQRVSMGGALNVSAAECELISTKIINVELISSPLKSTNRSSRNHDSINKVTYASSERNKGRYEERAREIFRKGKGGVKVIAKYKYPLTDEKSPMKKYIKIEKIKLPSPGPSSKTSSAKLKATINPQFS